MANRLIAIVVALALTACVQENRAQRSKPNYDVVTEGSASGVTSTINGPGETPAPMTATNADTTTNFTLPTNPNPLGNVTAGTSATGSIPSAYPNGVAPVRRQTPARTDTQRMVSAPGPVVTDTIGRPTPPMPKIRTTPDTDTNPTTSTTDTATTTDAQSSTSGDSNLSQPPPKKKGGDRNRKPEDQPAPTDTTGTQG